MRMIEEETLEKLANKAVEECKKGAIENLILSGIFDYFEVETDFIKMNISQADKWQAKDIPKELIINHGNYIHKFGNGIEYIIDELKRKKHGNRACLSLIDMKEIINSGDRAIPSFMIIQFGFSKNNSEILLVSCYFRALEVKCFLPINLTEICLLIKEIKKSFPDIKKFDLNIHTFRAQYIPKFHCLKKSEIDIVSPIKIFRYVNNGEQSNIIGLLKLKMDFDESIVISNGLKHLEEAFSDIGESIISGKIKIVICKIDELRQYRENTSIHADLKPYYEIIRSKIKEIIQEIEGWKPNES